MQTVETSSSANDNSAAAAVILTSSTQSTALLITELENSAAAYKRSATEARGQVLLNVLENVCWMLCFANADCLRQLQAGRYASILILTLNMALSKNRIMLRCKTVQALSLMSGLVPRGSRAIVLAKGIPPLLCLAKDAELTENTNLLEELLKCLSNISTEAQFDMVRGGAVAALVSLETRVQVSHLRILCLRSLANLFAGICPEEWASRYLLQSCLLFVSRFRESTLELLPFHGKTAEHLTKETETYFLCYLECISYIFDRVLCSPKAIRKNNIILEQTVPIILDILQHIAKKSLNRGLICNAACSPLLMLFITVPDVALGIFTKNNLIHTVCGILIAELDGWKTAWPHNSAAMVEVLNSNNFDSVPYISDEQQAISLLEFLLVIIPAVRDAGAGDWYVTLPHYIWQREDEFHNRVDFNESACKKLESEYQSQRISSRFSLCNIVHEENLLQVNFQHCRYTNRRHTYYSYILHRKPTFVGFAHQRAMRCCCGERSKSLLSLFGSCRRRSTTDGRATSKSSMNAPSVSVVSSNASQLVFGQMPIRSPNRTEGSTEHFLQYDASRTLDDFLSIRLVEDKSACCSAFKNFCLCGFSKKRNRRQNKHDSYLRNIQHLRSQIPRDLREEVLRSTETCLLFLNRSELCTLVSWCIPTCLTAIKRTVSPVIARHCSVLIFRCVHLVAEFMCWGHKSRLDIVNELQLKLSAMAPELCRVLTYLIVNVGSTGSQIVTAYPFSEFAGDPSLQETLLAMDVKPGAEKPAPSLLCEIQMSALSTFLLLHYFMPTVFRVFSDTQRLAVLRRIEKFFEVHESKPLSHRALDYDSTRHILCPFHARVQEIEESNKRLLKQVTVILQKEATGAPQRILSSASLDLSLNVVSCNLDLQGNECSRDTEVVNPLKMPSTVSCSPLSGDEIIKELHSIAGLYNERPETVKLIIALSNYIKTEGTDVSSLVHKIPDFLNFLATGLEDPAVKNSLDALAVEAFAHIAESLAFCINEHTEHVNLENISGIERQPLKISQRFCRSHLAVNFNDCMWTPLRVKLERSTTIDSSGKVCLRKGIIINGEKCAFLNVEPEKGFVPILPTTPLSYLAKLILSNLNTKNVKCREETPPLATRRNNARRHTISEGSPFEAFYPNHLVLLPFMDSAERESNYEDEDRSGSSPFNQLVATATNTDSLSLHGSGVQSPTSYTPLPGGLLEEETEELGIEEAVQQEQDQEVLTERVLSAFSVSLPYFMTKHNPLQPTMEKRCLPAREDSPVTVTIDSIIFICDGKPVTNLSASVLELCCNKYAMRKLVGSFSDGKQQVTLDEANKSSRRLLHKMHTLWSKVHSIQYAVLKKPIAREAHEAFSAKLFSNDDEIIKCYKNRTLKKMRDNSLKNVFTQLLQDDALPLRSAARLLHGLKNALRYSCGRVTLNDRRLCGALIYNFYAYHSTFMLPPLTLPALCHSFCGSRRQHLSCYILWNFPNVFSFEMRRTLLHLLLAGRRVESSVFTNLRYLLQRSGDEFRIHGLEWLTAEVSLHGTKRVIVSRSDVLNCGIKVLRSLAMCPLTLSVQFEMEDGAGVGPAQEFYNIFAKEMQSNSLRMWKTEEFINVDGVAELRVQSPLFPAVYQTPESLVYFEVLGLLVGRVLMEERVVDLPFHPAFLRGILGDFEGNKLSDIDYLLYEQNLRCTEMHEDELDECELFFVLPHGDGGHIELCRNGRNTKVTSNNVKSYVKAVERYYCHSVLIKPILSFMHGLRYTVIPEHLRLFVADELNLLICGPEGRIWDHLEDLKKVVIPSHGYCADSPVIHYLLEVLLAWSASLQRAFLRFVTGSNRIPIGGLQPPITVVRRPLGIVEESGVSSVEQGNLVISEKDVPLHQLVNASLPTVNTCVHYLKLPDYSTKELLERKLRKAIMEGQERFFLT